MTELAHSVDFSRPIGGRARNRRKQATLSTQDPYWKVKDVAARFKASRSTVYGWIKSGVLTAVRPSSGGAFRVPESAIAAMVHRATTAAPERPALTFPNPPPLPPIAPQRRRKPGNGPR
ncbi:hypothetical protein Pen01_60140 [Phytomonospora endophytica]|nr:hypothetical protein Pen01_60140 [Phytomonospora endophytica]